MAWPQKPPRTAWAQARSIAAAPGDGAQASVTAPRPRRQGLRRYIGPKRIFILLALSAAVVGAWYLRKHGILDVAAIEDFVRDHPVTGPIVMVLFYALAVLSGLPTLPINLAAGVVWGAVLGGLISACGTTLGAITVFAATRSIFGKPLAARVDNRLIAEFQKEFEEKGWRFIAFIRLNPALPTGPLNYVLALTGIDAFTYSWATFVFLIPSGIAVALIGRSVGTFVLKGNMSGIVTTVLTVSAAATVLAGLAYWGHLQRRLRKAETPNAAPMTTAAVSDESEAGAVQETNCSPQLTTSN
ncbi:MAG TPA: VTT domain-containing protein [Xanthobacteraceae bacterium]|nr:VTT domain-containing protein [Xanthobacteraceae bacterium]